MSGALITLLLAVAIGLLVREAAAWTWRLSAKIATKAAASMPDELESEYLNTYLGELETLRDRPLAAFIVSVRMALGSQETVQIRVTGRSPGAVTLSVKYLIDVVGGGSMVLLLAPVTFVSMLLVAVIMGRPVFYSIERIGRHGRPFKLYRLRTLSAPRRAPATQPDPHLTRVGKFLGAMAFDELPILWSVVKGDMSLVGPRPELPKVVAHYDEWQHRRHVVKPGVTGLWQVSDQSGRPTNETELDLEYIERFSLATDISILLRTVIGMLRRRGG